MGIFPKKQARKIAVNTENHGYKLDVITLKSGEPARVEFILSDSAGCMNEIVFKDLGIGKALDGKNEIVVNIPTDKPGTYSSIYGMDTFRGKVAVE